MYHSLTYDFFKRFFWHRLSLKHAKKQSWSPSCVEKLSLHFSEISLLQWRNGGGAPWGTFSPMPKPCPGHPPPFENLHLLLELAEEQSVPPLEKIHALPGAPLANYPYLPRCFHMHGTNKRTKCVCRHKASFVSYYLLPSYQLLLSTFSSN